MPRRAIFTDVMDVLERRIVEGDYMLRDLPGERKLADEVGVSYMTARKAVAGLIDKRVLTRKPNGTLKVHPAFRPGEPGPSVALLVPDHMSLHRAHRRIVVADAARAAGAMVRAVHYVHWYDPAVAEALDGADGLIVIPNGQPIPPKVVQAFAAPHRKVVFFGADLSAEGIPSVRVYPRDCLTVILDHLGSLGHRRIDLLDVTRPSDSRDRRIERWQDWLVGRGASGSLLTGRVATPTTVAADGYDLMNGALDRGMSGLGAVVCVTQLAAVGALRACHEAGLAIGRDVSVSAVINEISGRFFCPSLTGLEADDAAGLIERCVAWFASDDPRWPGELLLQPDRPNLFHGESTGPAKG